MANEIVRQQNIQIVLQQAMKLFVENGVENTSMEMIARASGLTLRSVQNYFHARNDLYAAVLNRGYLLELREMEAFFASRQYRSKNGAERVIAVISATLNKAVEYAETVFCTAQIQHILSRASEKSEKPQLTGNWVYMMEQLQKAFDRGISDGSIAQTTQEELVDGRTIVLALLGVREQVAYAMCDKTLRELFDPGAAVPKYIRQMHLMLAAKPQGEDGR
ncbi:MAG: TetR/AcrR family transcriptional regulator [Oscillospiraceae bacterium]|nr:TetR/AcrR family transcriptional regulator [Oscillospiraceae bacterium]